MLTNYKFENFSARRLHNCSGRKKTGASNLSTDISASRLSQRDPLGFPPHPREWLSIIVYQTSIMFYLEALILQDKIKSQSYYSSLHGLTRPCMRTGFINTRKAQTNSPFPEDLLPSRSTPLFGINKVPQRLLVVHRLLTDLQDSFRSYRWNQELLIRSLYRP